jgi:hypothetical protein
MASMKTPHRTPSGPDIVNTIVELAFRTSHLIPFELGVVKNCGARR